MTIIRQQIQQVWSRTDLRDSERTVMYLDLVEAEIHSVPQEAGNPLAKNIGRQRARIIAEECERIAALVS